ncbi:glycoside hydrolase family 13 protein [Guyanagaster necrorhizus]|uniref:Glycoside hydrolase family 13 protein n=1 Tax=Guyanagaster necrorhizus TaxID=856835 RepID=A0A9P7W2T9_9AGAR|nr:glycoside hydrolase family 13 protein [Guyanagaster necrorhizus MCA 3950]KAG7451163.1 glycoside hydrolase family 13 protein [Guyanagaster necrorhizus MCA 3950]
MKLGPDDSHDNPLMIQFFTWNSRHPEMSWWQHFESEIPRLSELGFTQVWLPPPNKAACKHGRGYDAYDLWDLGEFDQKDGIPTRWGTKEEFLHVCDVAKRYKIDIIIDAVLNHKLGADRRETFTAVPVNPQNRLKNDGKPREIEGWTAFDFPGRGGKYSTFRWNQTHFSGLDWDDRTRSKGIYRIEGPGHKGWSKNVDRELGNYDYLLGIDIDHRHPAVQEDLFNWGSWILQTTGAVGFRLDAIKHIDRRFLISFVSCYQRARSQNPRMLAVSEYWSGDVKSILPYIRAFKGQTAFFDVPLHMNFNQASLHWTRYDLRTILNNTIAKLKPQDAVTFVDNHDTVEGQSLESWVVGNNFKIQAYTIILLREEGYPCVFYGDVYPNTECFDANIARNVIRLIAARKLYAYGSTHEYLHGRTCIGFVRMGDLTHQGCAVLLSNKEESGDFVHSVRMNVGLRNAGSRFKSWMSDGGQVDIDAEGWGTFTCFPNYVQVWVKA